MAAVREPAALSEAEGARMALEESRKRKRQALSADDSQGRRAPAALAENGGKPASGCGESQADAVGAKRHRSGSGAGTGAGHCRWYVPLALLPALPHRSYLSLYSSRCVD
jgi:hypothetical protein